MIQNSWIITDDELANILEKEWDQLWSARYVEQLFSIITNLTNRELEKWFNIGLYGWRGSGKSSIIESLKKKIDKNNFSVIDFDCWKYSKDDLRRSFLIQICKVAGMKDKKTAIEQKFYQSIVKKETQTIFNKSDNQTWWNYIYLSEEFKSDLTNIRKSSRTYIVVTALFFIIYWLNKYLLEDVFNSSTKWTYSILTLLSWIIIHLTTLSNKLQSNLKIFRPVHTTTHQIFSNEQFEKEYTSILNNSYFKNKKILFIFDNIDRCDSETVKEILMTIKTFLDQKNCIFLLPIDYESICKHYHTDYSQWDEYLRKIFNLWIHIKNPQYDKLYKLVETIITKNNWKSELWITDEEIQEMSYILASVFANNPRKIKQFLNKLWAEHIWYNKEKNILALLKLLIIQQEIPELYKYLSNNLVYTDRIITHLESFWGDYEKLINYKKDWLAIYIKNIPEITEREMILLYELSAIQENLPFLDGEKSILWYIISNPQEFITITKDKNLQYAAKNIIEENISLVRKSLTHAKDILNLYIYYTIEYWIDRKLFNHMFKKNSIFFDIFEDEIIIQTDIIHKFINNISVDEIKTLWTKFQKRFSNLFFLKNNYKEFLNYFIKIDLKKQHLLINLDLLYDYIDDNEYIDFSEKDIEESIIFDFFTKYPKFITNNIIKKLLKEIPQYIWSIWSIQVFNKIRLLGLKKQIDKSIGDVIFNIAKEWLEISYIQWYNNNETYKFIIDGYLECAQLTLLSLPERGNKIVDNLLNIYNYWTKELQDNIISIFKADFNKRNPYSWWYADFIINQNIEKEFIKNLIEKTSYQNWNRKWLQDNQIKSIVENLWWNNDDKDIIVELWKRVSTKDTLIKSIMREELEDINTKIEYFKNHNIKISEKDRKNIWKYISEKIIKLINTHEPEDLWTACDFIITNIDSIKSLDKNNIMNALVNYPSEELDISINFENRRKESLKILWKN